MSQCPVQLGRPERGQICGQGSDAGPWITRHGLTRTVFKRRVQPRIRLVTDHNGPEPAEFVRRKLVVSHHDDVPHTRALKRGPHRVDRDRERERQASAGPASAARRDLALASNLTGTTSDHVNGPSALMMILPRHCPR